MFNLISSSTTQESHSPSLPMPLFRYYLLKPEYISSQRNITGWARYLVQTCRLRWGAPELVEPSSVGESAGGDLLIDVTDQHVADKKLNPVCERKTEMTPGGKRETDGNRFVKKSCDAVVVAWHCSLLCLWEEEFTDDGGRYACSNGEMFFKSIRRW